MTVAQALALIAAGLLAGLAEVLRRYEHMRTDMWRCPLVYVYLAINAGVGIAMLGLLQALDVPVASQGQAAITGVAGLAGLALLRTSISAKPVSPAKEHLQDDRLASSVAAGALALADFILRAADDQVRARFTGRLNDQARPFSEGWTFAESDRVGALCVELAKLPAAEEAKLVQEIARIGAGTTSDRFKVFLVARACIQYTGVSTLNTALEMDQPTPRAASPDADPVA